MTNKEAINFINFWLRELLHVGHTNVEEKSKILKLVRREIVMGLDMGFIQEDGEYVESGMAKLMGERYPELKVRDMKGLTVSSDVKENGLEEIGAYIEKNPMKVTYGDYIHWSKLTKYFATRRISLPIKTVEEFIDYKSNIAFKNGKFVLKTKEQ